MEKVKISFYFFFKDKLILKKYFTNIKQILQSYYQEVSLLNLLKSLHIKDKKLQHKQAIKWLQKEVFYVKNFLVGIIL